MALLSLLKKTKTTCEAKTTGQHTAQSQPTAAQTTAILAQIQTKTEPNWTKRQTKLNHNQTIAKLNQTKYKILNQKAQVLHEETPLGALKASFFDPCSFFRDFACCCLVSTA